jgi:hypothetical protein
VSPVRYELVFYILVYDIHILEKKWKYNETVH